MYASPKRFFPVFRMDGFFCYGAKMIFQLTLTILAKCEKYINDCKDDGEAMIQCQEYFKNVVRSDAYDDVRRSTIFFCIFLSITTYYVLDFRMKRVRSQNFT